ncbi:helix-turn-helix domain-containing protein [Flavobacterium sp. TP390]|uniref:Helix-turn-helix domain-containing protein n=1 Tax=Flavobacterium profundi TaxID=1774945 RepID=A0A6I4II69_9FLAO|nr:AraC family transcriptional regulator [Flavobacterium profundi]MVO09385.1 helix-turn-helix domain-containing protein [Flavobacterium profundi]
MINLIDFILSGAAFLLAFIIFVNTNKVNTKANKWFGTFVFCIFLLFLENVLLFTKLLKEDDIFIEIISISSFVISPIFYLSVSYFVAPIKKWKTIEFLHFFFALLMLLLILMSHLFEAYVEPEEVNPETVANVTIVFNIIFSLQVVPYCIMAFIKIIKHQKNIQSFNSTIENVDLKWLKNIIISVFVIAVFWVGDIVFKLSDTNSIFNLGSSLLYLIGILYIAYYWLKQKEIFPYNLIEKEEIETIIAEKALPEDNRKKLLTDEKLEELKIELLELISSKKPFLDNELSLVKLASLLNVSPHILSYLINKGFDENFFQFVNRYRIEEAKKLLLDPKMAHLSLLGIGFEVGFNSKTVFNTTFKKVTGQTPSEFKQQ